MIMQLEHERVVREQDETIHHMESVHQQKGAYYQDEIQRLRAELEGLRVHDAGPGIRGPPDCDNGDEGDNEDRAKS